MFVIGKMNFMVDMAVLFGSKKCEYIVYPMMLMLTTISCRQIMLIFVSGMAKD